MKVPPEVELPQTDMCSRSSHEGLKWLDFEMKGGRKSLVKKRLHGQLEIEI